jgi:hypothetical protein
VRFLSGFGVIARRATFRRPRATAPLLAMILIACASTPVTRAANPQAEQVLLLHVPAPIAATCVSQEPADATRQAQVSCRPGGTIAEAVYVLFDGNESMDAAYQSHLTAFPGATGENCSTGPSQGNYAIGGVPSGDLFCDLNNGAAFIEWTDKRFSILSFGSSTSSDFGTLYDWWANEAGPNEASAEPLPTSAPATPGLPGEATPAPTPAGTPTPGDGDGPKVPETPPSRVTGASIHQLLFAEAIGAEGPLGIADAFRTGTPRIYTLVAWHLIEVGAELDLKLFQGDRLMAQQHFTPKHPHPQLPKIDIDGGYAIPFEPDGGFVDGEYTVELDYHGLPEQVASFVVNAAGDGAPRPGNLSAGPSGSNPDFGPIPYVDPASVLIVTRSSVLRARMPNEADAVLAAAAKVGTVHDLTAELGPSPVPIPAAVTVPIIQNLLKAGSYKYLLILGNDDTVGFPQVALPDSVNYTFELWDRTPGDYVVTDDVYVNLDGDEHQIPDMPVARIPSSDDAALLLTQLGENQPQPSTAFAFVNEAFRGVTEGQLEVINSITPLTLYYSPPTMDDKVPQTNQKTARFIYILLHGIGSFTEKWSGEIQKWTPLDPNDPLTQYTVEEKGFPASLTTATAGAPGAVVNTGACFGGYTLDTVMGSTHKTRDNSLALDFLATGSRSFVGSTYTSVLGPFTEVGDPPEMATGFEILFWQGIKAGQTPIDAFFSAKAEYGRLVVERYAIGTPNAALQADQTFLALHEMQYYGRP